jgi:hypothetical protein
MPTPNSAIESAVRTFCASFLNPAGRRREEVMYNFLSRGAFHGLSANGGRLSEGMERQSV